MAIAKEYTNENEPLQISSDYNNEIIPLQEDKIIELSKDEPLELNRRAVFLQISISILVSLPILSSGMSLSFSAITFDSLTNRSNPIAISEDEASWFASINALVYPIGCLCSSYILDRYGRKKTLYLICTLALLSWVLIAASSFNDKNAMYIQLMVARVIIGISGGLSMTATGVYCAEVVHPKLRGLLSVLTILTLAIGIWITYFLGYFITDWRFISALIAVFTFVCIIILIPIPESYVWLTSKGRFKEADKTLRFFNGLPKSRCHTKLKRESNVSFIIKTKINPSSKESLWMKLKLPEFYKPFGMMITLFTFQYLSGVGVIIVYAVGFSSSISVNIDPFLCAIFIGIVRMMASLITGFLSIHFGHRRPAMCSGFIAAASMFGLIAFLHYRPINVDWLPFVLILVYVFSGSIGLVTIPYALVAEIYPQKVRGFAAGMTSAYGFALYFIVVKLYPMMLRKIGIINIILIFAVTSFLSIFFVYFVLPETKNKTLKEIEDIFKKKEKAYTTNNES